MRHAMKTPTARGARGRLRGDHLGRQIAHENNRHRAAPQDSAEAARVSLLVNRFRVSDVLAPTLAALAFGGRC